MTERPGDRTAQGAPALARARTALPTALAVVLILFATGVWSRPGGPAWAFTYDVVLYNAVYALAAVWSWRAARSGGGPAGRWLAGGLALNGVANVVYTMLVATQDDPPYPSMADGLFLAFYPLLYVAVVRRVRTRVPRFRLSMWLDGLIGAFGAAAVAIAVLLAPALRDLGGRPAELATNLAFPVADVLLLALLVGVGGALGLRSDRALLALAAGLVLHLVGDVVYLDLEAMGRYVEGGPLDLTWLVGVACMALGVQPHRPAAPPVRTSAARDLVAWRVLTIPVGCSAASVGLLGAGWGDRLPASVACCAISCLVVVVVRTAMTFRELRRLHDVGREARTDELTGLPNRRALLEHAAGVVSAATPDRPAALVLLDLDGFKEVNDGLGHGAGDELLRQIGARMAARLEPTATLARLGGDEFAVVLPGADAAVAYRVAQELRGGFDEPFSVDGVRLTVGASFGIATAPVPATTVTELVRCADVAMYLAKDSTSGIEVFLSDGAHSACDRLRLMAELRTALDVGQLTIHLQPQMSLTHGRTVGAKASVRWDHPHRGLLDAGVVLAVAEQAGLQAALTDRVLDVALAAAARWWRHRPPLPVAVELGATSIADVRLPGRVSEALHRHDLSARALTVEVAEDTLVAGGDRARAVLAELRDLGVAVAIVRFGTGRSALAHLRSLAVDRLELVPELGSHVAADPRAVAVVEGTVRLAHGLGLELATDAVDDPAAVGVLAELGCDRVQGDEVAPAMPVDTFLTWLRRRPADRTAGSDLSRVLVAAR